MHKTKKIHTSRIISALLACVFMFGVLATVPLHVDAASYNVGTYIVTHKNGVNVRKGAGTSYGVVGAAKKDTKFEVTKVSKEWGYTKSINTTSGTKAGWVCLDYCKANTPAKTKITFTSVCAPNDGNLIQGSGYHLTGKVTSTGSNIISVRGQVLNAKSNEVMAKTVSVNTSSFVLTNSALDDALTFGKLAAGSYTLKYTVKTKDGTSATKSCSFKVIKRQTSELSTSANAATNTSVAKRIDELCDKLDGKYFTVDGNGHQCGKWTSDHGCSNCYNVNVVATKWFKEKFGSVKVNQFPESYGYGADANGYFSKGYSCLGFAHFAEWYIFRTKDTAKVKVNKIGTYSFDADSVKSKAKMGDIFRLDNRHSIIFIKTTSKGVEVLDCNYNGTYNCQVHQHTIPYSAWSQFTISRAVPV